MKEPTMTQNVWNNFKDKFWNNNIKTNPESTRWQDYDTNHLPIAHGHQYYYEAENKAISQENFNKLTELYKSGMVGGETVIQSLPSFNTQINYPIETDDFLAQYHELFLLPNIFAIMLNKENRYAAVFYMRDDSVEVMPSVELFRKIEDEIARGFVENVQEHLEWIVDHPGYLTGLKSDWISQAGIRELTTQYV